jgi:alpha-methylacyl-CoA racemase
MGTLTGVRVIEMAAIGPVPLCGMMLADMGADVVRIDRVTPGGLGLEMEEELQPAGRGKQSIALDLKDKQGVEIALRLVERADVLLEGFRPGVMERLGLGPDVCQERNPRLVYGRMTGWGQQGPWAHTAGHDINYIALTGALHSIGTPGGPPVPPLNLVGDYGGGTLYLAVGVLAALVERSRSGQGQVVDAAMVGANPIDGGSHFYCVYETADGEYMAVGAIEPKFYEALLTGVGLAADAELSSRQMDPATWSRSRRKLTEAFRSRTRAEWTAVFEGTDACVAPVLRPSEAPAHPHLSARGTLVTAGGLVQPAPAPRFDRTPSQASPRRVRTGEHSAAILRGLGFTAEEAADLARRKLVQ